MDEHRARELLGPYLLGGLSGEEKRELEERLDSCPEFQRELDELRKAHEFLNEPSYSPPPELKERILAQAAGEEESTNGADGLDRVTRRRRRLVKGVAAPLVAAGLLVAAFLLGGMLSEGLPYPGGPDESVALSPTGLAPGSGGELRVAGSGSNYDVELEVWGLPEPEEDGHYELWFVGGDGRMSAGTFRVAPEGRTSVSLSVPSTARSYQNVGITREPGDGDPMPSGEKVLGAQLSDEPLAVHPPSTVSPKPESPAEIGPASQETASGGDGSSAGPHS